MGSRILHSNAVIRLFVSKFEEFSFLDNVHVHVHLFLTFPV